MLQPETDTFDFETAAREGPIGDTYRSNADDPGGYNIDVNFLGGWTQDLKQAAATAVETISDFVLGDLPDMRLSGGDVVDDLSIDMTLFEGDGPGGVLASAGPSSIRFDGGQTIEGQARFDVADAAALSESGAFADVVTHEALHVLGLGTLWEQGGNDLLAETGGGLRFTGENAIAAYRQAFPDIAADDRFSDRGVPVEAEFGPGSARGHWDEDVFGDSELMTPRLGQDNPLTDLTIASLSDLGYQTTFDETVLA